MIRTGEAFHYATAGCTIVLLLEDQGMRPGSCVSTTSKHRDSKVFVLQSGDCVEAHTNVDVVVNLEQFKELLDSRLPLVFQGSPVAEAEIAWPGRDFDLPSPFPETQ